MLDVKANQSLFQSTHPVWDATGISDVSANVIYISIHASRMGCDLIHTVSQTHVIISIHASRMGCDPACRVYHVRLMDFNPRIPYGMRRIDSDNSTASGEFQSTHPVWDATFLGAVLTPGGLYFNPRIPYGMRRQGFLQDVGRNRNLFQSTHPVWDATARMDIAFHNMEIIARSSS